MRPRIGQIRWLLALALTLLTLLGCARQDQSGALVEGNPAPDFTLPAADGRMVSLADYRQKQPVLLYFHMAIG